MAPVGRWKIGDEELGKKDDDHKYRGKHGGGVPPGPDLWGVFRPRRKRIIQVVIGLFLLYLFIKNMPERQSGSIEIDEGMQLPHQQPSGHALQENSKSQEPFPAGQPPHSPEDDVDAAKHYYNGLIRFQRLAISLQQAARFNGNHPVNKNIVFAAASIKSISNLLPMACEMARWRRNYVHFLLTGREELSIEKIMQINGIGDECRITWHDGRPDYAPYSSNFRMEVSSTSAFDHVASLISPQAFIVDNAAIEESYMLKAVRGVAREKGKALIELPFNANEGLKWITRLDSGSLSSWNSASVEILVQAPAESSGSLLRLLRSLQQADYFSTAPPRLTIELPNKIDKPLQEYLYWLKWPPPASQQDSGDHQSLLTLRHRIPDHASNPVEASTRLLESFYPANPHSSHVLLLSPQVELSPLWYHYVKYSLLEYKYSHYGHEDTTNLLGLSFSIPDTYLDHVTPFKPPLVDVALGADSPPENGTGSPTNFLWQAPNSNAALYFGDKWKEFHSFLTHRLSSSPLTEHKKLISKAEPAWMEYLLEMASARGYFMIYPTFAEGQGVVTVHHELYHAPEEWSQEPTEKKDAGVDERLDFTDSPAAHKKHIEPKLGTTSSLLSLLPDDGDLPEVPMLPILSTSGERLPFHTLEERTEKYAKAFREETGGCTSNMNVPGRQFEGASDLFCDGDEVDYEVVVPLPKMKPAKPELVSPRLENLDAMGKRNNTTVDVPKPAPKGGEYVPIGLF